jgi:hypothetical protein
MMALFGAILLSGFTFVFSGAFLRAVYKDLGFLRYTLTCLVVVGLLGVAQIYALAMLFAISALLIGLQNWLEEKKLKLVTSAGVSLFVVAAILGAVFYFWTKQAGVGWETEMTDMIRSWLAQFVVQDSKSQVQPESILRELPSGVFIALIGTLTLAFTLEKRIGRLMRFPPAMRVSPAAQETGEFRLPDWIIWIFLAALLGAFYNHSNENLKLVSVNLINVLIFLYFLQGMAVSAAYLRKQKATTLWRGFFYLMATVLLFQFVAAVGFIDYWADFRNKLINRSPTNN